MADTTTLPELPRALAPRCGGRSPAEQRWAGELTEANLLHVRARLEELLLGRVFTITRAYSYNDWELEVFPIARLADGDREDAGVYVHMGHVEFAAADWHWALYPGMQLHFEDDRLSVRAMTPEGKPYRMVFARLEDGRDLHVVFGPTEAAMIREVCPPVRAHVEFVFGGGADVVRKWLP